MTEPEGLLGKEEHPRGAWPCVVHVYGILIRDVRLPVTGDVMLYVTELNFLGLPHTVGREPGSLGPLFWHFDGWHDYHDSAASYRIALRGIFTPRGPHLLMDAISDRGQPMLSAVRRVRRLYESPIRISPGGTSRS